jgi:hypothetical protein
LSLDSFPFDAFNFHAPFWEFGCTAKMVALHHEDDEPASETSPLVGDGNPPRNSPGNLPNQSSHNHPRFLRVVIMVIATVFVIQVADYMVKAPLMRLLEDIICRKYYESAKPADIDFSLPIPEENCKLPPIQSQLAIFKGWDMVISCVPGILLSVPYGILADNHGRRFVLLLGQAGLTLALLWGLFVSEFESFSLF